MSFTANPSNIVSTTVRFVPDDGRVIYASTVGQARGLVGETYATKSLMLLGTNSPGDGGGGAFFWSPSSTGADDSGSTTIRPYGVSVGAWRRETSISSRGGVFDGLLNVKNAPFNAVGDGATDDTAAIQSALNAAPGTVYFPPGTYRYTVPLLMKPNTRILGAGSAQSIFKVNVPNVSGGVGFLNPLGQSLGGFTQIPTTPSVQTDLNFAWEDIGFDCSLFTGPVIAFLFAQHLLIRNVRMDNFLPSSSTPYTGMELVGCNDIVVADTYFRNVASSVNGWKGTTNVKISNHHAIAAIPTDTGVVALNGQGTIVSDQEFSSGFEITNSTIICDAPGSGVVALYFDSLGGGSSVTDVFISNVHVHARAGLDNAALVARGRGGRIKINGLNITAAAGAGYSAGGEGAGGVIIVGLSYDFPSSPPTTASGIISTVAGNNVITIGPLPNGTSSGPGNYFYITSGTGGPLVANGLSLNGYYPVLSVSGPPSQFVSGNVVTVQVPNNATVTGPITASATVVGFLGSFTDCEFNGITFDGVVAPNVFLMNINGDGHVFSNIVHTRNFNGASSPQYLGALGVSQTQVPAGYAIRPIEVVNMVVDPGTGVLPAGFTGNNVIAWGVGGPRPMVANTPGDPTASGTWVPTLEFNGQSTGITYTNRQGTWSRTGSIAYFSCAIALSSKGSAVGSALIFGLPFQASGASVSFDAYTANFFELTTAPQSSRTAPIVTTVSVNGLLYTLVSAGSGGATGTYAMGYSGGTGSGAFATFTVLGVDSVASTTIASPGSGGTDGQYSITAVGASTNPCQVAVSVVGGSIARADLVQGGSGYSATPTLPLSSIPGLTGASVTLTLGVGAISSMNPQDPGNYTVAPTISTAAAPGLTGASITAAVNTIGTPLQEDVRGFINGNAITLTIGSRDQIANPLTDANFTNASFLNMVGWYFVAPGS